MSSQQPWWARTLRTVGIVLLGLTAAFTLLGGAGTTCVALNPTGFGDKFAGLAPFQWLYILFVILTLAIGVFGVRAVVFVVRGRRHSYRGALLVLGAGLLVGGIHMAASRLLRGSSMPVDMVVYTTAVTLAVFLLFRLPGLWNTMEWEAPAMRSTHGGSASAIALGLTGLLTLTVQFVMAPTHTWNGINYADVWHTALTAMALAQWLLSGYVYARMQRRADHPRLAASTASFS